MPAPDLTLSFSNTRVSKVSGYSACRVEWTADMGVARWEARATRSGSALGRGIGILLASSQNFVPAGEIVSFLIFGTNLTLGDGAYRISIYAANSSGDWNDNINFVPSGSAGLITSDKKHFLSERT